MKSIRIYKTISLILSLGVTISLTACSLVHSFDPDDFTIDSIAFDRTSLSLPQGSMDMLSLSIEPASAQAGAGVAWEFDDTLIAGYADNFGLIITGVNPGEAVVRAAAYGKTAACVVTVLPGTGEKSVPNPYVYSNTEFVEVAPGDTVKVSASLYGGNSGDISGFSFSIDKPAVASLLTEGNYCRITGGAEGIARVTVRHTRAAFGYSFLVSCQPDGRAVPYLTTSSNVITLNRSLENEASFTVEILNPPPSYEGTFAYALLDGDGKALPNPPAAVFANGGQCRITPLRAGDCFVRVSHPAALYPLDVLVRVVEQIDTVYIEPSQSMISLGGASAQTLSLSLQNLPPGVSASSRDYSWNFPPDAPGYIDWHIYGGDGEGKGDTAWLAGKKRGTLRITVSHPLASQKREILVVVRDMAEDAARASTYISTSQNYVRTRAGDENTSLSIYINNALPGDENDLSWAIENKAADGSGDPVIAYIAGTGTTPAARSAMSAASGYALIAPLREGTAVITVSHPKAVYGTKILVEVAAAGTPPESPLALSSATPYITLQNGSSREISVALQGPGKTGADTAAILWDYPGTALSLAANGESAGITALGSGSSTETITVSHPKATRPLSIAVLRYDSGDQLEAVRLVYTDTPYHTLREGETASLSVRTVNPAPDDIIQWNVTKGNESVIVFERIDGLNARVTAAAAGEAEVEATLAGTPEKVSFSVTVLRDGVADPEAPSYLTTNRNVVTLEAGGGDTVPVIPVNIAESHYSAFSWTVSDPSLVEVIPNGRIAAVRSVAGGGKAVITVTHPLAANALEIHVHIGDEYDYRNTDLAYISTPADTLLLRLGDEDTLFRAVLAHTESSALSASGFSFRIADTAVAAVSWSSLSNGCFISPKSPGQTILTVSHGEAVYDKEVLVIVDRPQGDSGEVPYISTTGNVITVMAGDYATAAVTLANAQSPDPASWNWQSHDTRIARVTVNNGTTAMIQGNDPGTTFVTVSNAASPYPLKLIVICLDSAMAQAKPWIKTDANIITVKTGAAKTLSAEMAGGDPADNALFLWSSSDASKVLVSGTGASASVRGMAAGTAYVTVRNSRYPEAYTKTVLVLVEDGIKDECYITVNQRIVKLKPDAKDQVTLKATLVGGDALDPEGFVWWADDYHILNTTFLTDTARLEPSGVSGVTAVHVKHPKALETADIVVMVSAFESFAFDTNSKTVKKGSLAFIPLRVPPSAEKTRVEYSSADPSVCAVTGSGSVAMIAGVRDGYTTVTATLKAGTAVIATAGMGVIVSPAADNPARITTKSTVLNMERGTSLTVEAALQGAGINPTDGYDISWKSSDPNILSLLATEQNITKGNSAYVTAKAAGEAVLTLSHPKCDTSLDIWILIPPGNEVSIILDQTYIELYKDDGAVSVSATLLNGSPADYASVTWTAPKVGGQIIVSVSKANGKTCNIVPRNVGNTTLRAQLPNGKYADCVVSVSSAAEITLDTQTIHVNPGYTQTVRYHTNPEAAQVTWIAQSNGSADASEFFTFQVNEAAKTVSVTGLKLGGGMLNAYFTGSSGSATSRIQIYVEYTYEFELKTSGILTAEPRNANTLSIPFRVFPADLEISAQVSDPAKLEVKSVSLNKLTGEGKVEVTPLGEKNGLFVTISATNPRDRINTPIIRTQYINLRYQNLTITPVFDFEAGSFSNYDGRANTLYLGDGEEALFHLKVLEENTVLENLRVFWQSVSGSSADNTAAESGGAVTLGKENSAAPSGEQLWRIGHNSDYLSEEPYYLISRDLKYRVWKVTFSGNIYPVQIPYETFDDEGLSHIYYTTEYRANQWQSTGPVEIRSADPNTGILSWYVYTSDWWDMLNHKQRAYIGADMASPVMSRAMGRAFDGEEKTWKYDDTRTYSYTSDDDSGTVLASYEEGDVYYCEVFYDHVAPYVLRKSTFEANPNYYRPEMSGREYDWGEWWSSSNSWDAVFGEARFHKYATPTPSKNSAVIRTYYGQIKLTYNRFDGTPGENVINVQIQKRECEAYNNGKWREVSPGRWEIR
ncbi:MAG: Ig-like domain-containing protein [Treponema sp.]|jgi:hypothetical protein|nr:Ig-like domain-containing protein [Treponema sp.]